MKTLKLSPSLTDQVYQAVVDEILEGQLKQGEHLVQEQVAARLGVSRQPVQHAMALLKADGLVEDVGRRGLRVAALDLTRMRGHYDIRQMLDGYAAHRTALAIADRRLSEQQCRDTIEALFEDGAAAIRAGSVRDQIYCDEALHKLFYDLSGNPVLEEMAEPNWRHLRRVMAEVLRLAEPATTIWEQHRGIVEAVLTGEADLARERAENHVRSAADRLMSALTRHGLATDKQASVA